MEILTIEVWLKRIGGVLGLIQGVIWLIMCYICHKIYFDVDNSVWTPTSYMDSVGLNILNMFLFNENLFAGRIFTAPVFYAFVWIHFVFNAAWLCLSMLVLRFYYGSIYVKLWGFCALTVSMLDFITFVILDSDYNKCVNAVNGSDFDKLMEWQAYCASTILPVFFIAAKGFILWLINICFGLFLIQFSKKMKEVGF